MTSFDFVVGVGALCGVIMVAGSIYLLRVGAISLKQISTTGDKTALELAYKEIKVATQYPALALFIIGLAFVLGSAYLSKPTVARIPIAVKIIPSPGMTLSGGIKAKIDVEEIIPISNTSETRYTYSNQLNPSNIWGTILIPSVRPIERLLQLKNGVWRLDLDLTGVVDSSLPQKPPSGDRKIAPVE
jgi:hypothetical protein